VKEHRDCKSGFLDQRGIAILSVRLRYDRHFLADDMSEGGGGVVSRKKLT
jgi:hypothetical protein